MLGVFLLLAFAHLGNECQDLLSPCNGMHVCTDKASVYTLIQKSFRGMESEPMLTPGGKSLPPETQRRVEPATLYHTGERPNTWLAELQCLFFSDAHNTSFLIFYSQLDLWGLWFVLDFCECDGVATRQVITL